MSQDIVACGLSDIGRRRRTNQDKVVALPGLYAVCDGMGGAQGGERASAIAAEQLGALARLPRRGPEDILHALGQAQGQAIALGRSLGGVAGTTVTGVVCATTPADGSSTADGGWHGRHAVGGSADDTLGDDTLGGGFPGTGVDDDATLPHDGVRAAAGGPASPGRPAAAAVPRCYVVNVGDSRTYHLDRFPDGSLNEHSFRQVTRDHSRRQEALDGGMDPREVERTIARNVITQCVGAPCGIRPDLFEMPAAGRFVVCSDGLHAEVSDAAIAAIAARHPDAGQAARLLIEAALEAGGNDNVSVIVVDMPHRMAAFTGTEADDPADRTVES